MKHYDRRYFERWYRGRGRISTAAEVRRKVAMAVAVTEYFLRRPLRSMLDVACGEGAWFPHLKALRPRVSYRGIDSSDYAVERFGRERRIAKASFGEIASLSLGGPFDLVACADALHYIDDHEIRAGLPELVRLAGGLLYLEVLTGEDEIIGDLEGLIRRPARWYRSVFAAAGLTSVGPYLWLAPHLREEAAALEHTSSRA